MSGNEEIYASAMSQGHSAAWDQDWVQAAGHYRRALEEFPGDAKALSNLGLALYESAEYEAAYGIYLSASQVSPQDPIPLEKLGQISEILDNIDNLVRASMKAAELYQEQGNRAKAVENLIRITRNQVENLAAHSRLAYLYEIQGKQIPAATEYLVVAGLLQHRGDVVGADQAARRALQLAPDSTEASQAVQMIGEGKLLPRPRSSQAPGEAPQMARRREASQARPACFSGLDPIAAAHKLALSMLAGIVLEQPVVAQNDQQQFVQRGLQGILNSGPRNLPAKQDSAFMQECLSRAVDFLSQGNDEAAAGNLEAAIQAGLEHAAAFFEIGFIRAQGQQLESAIRYLQRAVNNSDFSLAGRLLLGQAFDLWGRFDEAAIEYLEALRCADSMVVPAEQADELQQLYDPIIEAESGRSDAAAKRKICDAIKGLLLRPDWREYLREMRAELLGEVDGGPPIPLGEVYGGEGSNQIVEAIRSIHQLARAGFLRSAMEEAFFALTFAPTYLPLHTHMGELLLQEDRLPEAIEKFTVAAQTYSTRGEAGRAIRILRRILRAAPMDLGAHHRLIELLIARGSMTEAIQEYMDLAGVYYHLADLNQARKNYQEALRLAQQSRDDWQLIIEILHHLADIDLQSLDWRQAQAIYEQIRSMQPTDERARLNLIGLNLRLSQEAQAEVELRDYLGALNQAGALEEQISFLEDLSGEYPQTGFVHRALAEVYREAGRRPDAIREFDTARERYLQAGDHRSAAEVIDLILALDPLDREGYQQQLQQLRGAGSAET